jgi:hypothetical protein
VRGEATTAFDHVPESRRAVHCKRERHHVYIGRPSKWGNPFVVGKHGQRGECIALYEN